MGEQPHVLVTEADRDVAREDVRKTSRGTNIGGILFVAVATFGGVVLAESVFPEIHGTFRALASAAVAAVLAVPLLLLVAAPAKRRAVVSGSERSAQERAMRADATRREFESQLNRALEMVDDEPSAFDVIERAMTKIAPTAPVELLLADNSHAHLDRVVVSAPEGVGQPDCSVSSPDACIAARRAQTQVFPDSEELDACPMLRGRERGRCSAVCVPVSIMGRTVGVVHAVSETNEPLDDSAVRALQTLANQSGNRLGMLRVMAETHVHAATDALTGLVNRRDLENRLRHMRNEGTEFVFVMADLDNFKTLNDNHGHETGDRALRIFADTLRHELRADDIASRYGGEEFSIVLPGADTSQAVEIVERIRRGLARTTSRGEAPAFTASFGIAYSGDAEDLKDLVERADRALFAAKDAGRDRTCIDGHSQPVAPTLTALG